MSGGYTKNVFSELEVENSDGMVKGVNEGMVYSDNSGARFYVKGAYKNPSEHAEEDKELERKQQLLESEIGDLESARVELEAIQKNKMDFENELWDMDDPEIDIYAVSDALEGVLEPNFEGGSKAEKLYEQGLEINEKAKGIDEKLSENEEASRKAKEELEVVKETPNVSRTHKEICTEFLVGNLYQKILPDQAPVIGLITDDSNPERVSLSSKMFEGYQSLREYSDPDDLYGLEKTTINPEAPELSELKGFENVLAACTILGEFDYHGDNIGVVDGMVVKIDHGMSARFEDSKEYFKKNAVPSGAITPEEIDMHAGLGGEIALRMKVFAYQNIPCDLEKFKEALDRMVPVLREDAQGEFEKTTEDLEAIGVKDIPDYSDALKKRLSQAHALSKQIELFAKMEPGISAYEFFVDRVYQEVDPIIYALEKRKTIDGEAPLAYASKVEHKIKLKDGRELSALEYATEKGIPIGDLGRKAEKSAVESTLKDMAPRRERDFEKSTETGHQGVSGGGDYKDKETGHKSHLKGGKKAPNQQDLQEFEKALQVEEDKIDEAGEAIQNKIDSLEVKLEEAEKLKKILQNELKQKGMKTSLDDAIKEYNSLGEYPKFEDGSEEMKYFQQSIALQDLIEQTSQSLERADLEYDQIALEFDMLQKKPNPYMEHEDTYKELVFGRLYNRLLPTQSPKIALVVGDDEIQTDDLRQKALRDKSTELTVRSKFFDNYQSLSDYSRYGDKPALPNGQIYKEAPQLKELEGFENVMAACLALGEYDHHAHNLGVVQRKSGKYEVVKIDHGLSGTFDYDARTAQDMGHDGSYPAGAELAIYLEQYSYQNIPFNIAKFKQALDGMVVALRSEAQDIIDKSVYELDSLGAAKPRDAKSDKPEITPYILKSAGVKFEIDELPEGHIDFKSLEEAGIDITPEQYEKAFSHAEYLYELGSLGAAKPEITAYNLESAGVKFKVAELPEGHIDFKSLEKAGIDITPEQYEKAFAMAKSTLVRKMEGRLEEIEKLSTHLEVFTKMEPAIPGYEFFVGSKVYQEADPIAYAQKHGKTIDGKEPLVWALENGQKIDGMDPIQWAFEQKGQIKIEGQYPLRYAVIQDIQISTENGTKISAEEFAETRNHSIEPQIAARPKKLNVKQKAADIAKDLSQNVQVESEERPVPKPRRGKKPVPKPRVEDSKPIPAPRKVKDEAKKVGEKLGKVPPPVKPKPKKGLKAGVKEVVADVKRKSDSKPKKKVSKNMAARLAMFENPTRTQ